MDRYKEEAPNHGRGRCLKATVVWKLNMEEGIKELYCIAQNPRVAQGVREKFEDEARRYNIDPKYYVTWEDRPVMWSRTIFPDRFRLINVEDGKTIWATENKTGEFNRLAGARRMGNRLVKQGKIKGYKVTKWNRQRSRWDEVTVDTKTAVTKLSKF